MIILIPEIWEPDDDGPDRSMMWNALHFFFVTEQYFSVLSPELFTKFGPPKAFIGSKTQFSSTNSSDASLLMMF